MFFLTRFGYSLMPDSEMIDVTSEAHHLRHEHSTSNEKLSSETDKYSWNPLNVLLKRRKQQMIIRE